MGYIIDSGRVATEARRESFYLIFPTDTPCYDHSVELEYKDLAPLVKALAELSEYLALHDRANFESAHVAGQSHFEPEQNAHQFKVGGYLMEPVYEFIDGLIA